MRERHARRREERGVPDHLTCEQCGEDYVPAQSITMEFKRGRRFCSMACRDEYLRSGGARSGEDHPSWLGDDAKPISIRARARLIRVRRGAGYCESCTFMLASETHHKDGNPLNNADENLAFLCMGCHDLAHLGETVWDSAVAA